VIAGDWRSDATVWMVRRDGRWLACGGSMLRSKDSVVFEASAPLASMALRPDAGGFAGEVVATRKTFVAFGGDVDAPEFSLDGIVVPAEERNGKLGILLPAEGRYAVSVTRATTTRP
jgi:hypothetical protein